MSAEAFATRLLQWFDLHGRHDLPWQHPRTPYRVWLSEIMLQQTQVSVVIGYFQRFVAALPDLPALAAAPQEQVMALWSGLGYYSRARNLHAAAQLCMERHDGDLPRDLDALIALPGIGRSTAGAILAQAWGERAPILDGNVKRVLTRLHGIAGWPGAPRIEKSLWTLAESLLPAQRLADYTQALMDLGATVCTRQRPRCESCPFATVCVAYAQDRVAELPTRKPSKALPHRHATVLLLINEEGATLLQHRTGKGVWHGLWSLPQFDDEDDARQWCNLHARNTMRLRALPAIDHVFSHYKLTLQPLLAHGVRKKTAIRDNDALRWVPREALASLGIPAPIRTLLENL